MPPWRQAMIPCVDDAPELARTLAASVQQRIAFGERAGQQVRRIGAGFGHEGETPTLTGPRCASVHGFPYTPTPRSPPIGATSWNAWQPQRYQLPVTRPPSGPYPAAAPTTSSRWRAGGAEDGPGGAGRPGGLGGAFRQGARRGVQADASAGTRGRAARGEHGGRGRWKRPFEFPILAFTSRLPPPTPMSMSPVSMRNAFAIGTSTIRL